MRDIIKTFYVTGRGVFPTDMLRYDKAWPVDAEAQDMIRAEVGDKTIRIGEFAMYDWNGKGPTIARWGSFLFGCSLDDPR